MRQRKLIGLTHSLDYFSDLKNWVSAGKYRLAAFRLFRLIAALALIIFMVLKFG